MWIPVDFAFVLSSSQRLLLEIPRVYADPTDPEPNSARLRHRTIEILGGRVIIFITVKRISLRT